MSLSQNNSGSVVGGILLVAGCCIGAAMLGLPILTAITGFQPSLIMFVGSWFFMLVTGLLLLEVNLWFYDEVSIISMADRTLGWTGKVVGWLTFLFLFYSLMVAYVSGTGVLFADFVHELAGIRIPDWVGSFGISMLFAVLIYSGTGFVDRFNRILMAGLIITYLVLVTTGLPHVNIEYLKFTDWNISIFVVPAMIVSFGYHNLIPSLTTYLNGDVKKLRTTIFIGSLIPLVIYLVWEFVILGLVPVEGGFRQALDEGQMATRVLRQAVGASWVVDAAEYFAFFAIVTSFLCVALSFVDFLADGLHMKKDAKGKMILCSLTLVPPLVFSFIYQKMFLQALNYAGAFGAVVLFGILPAAMVWSGRYREKMDKPHMVPGGKITLVLVILISVGIIISEIMHEV